MSRNRYPGYCYCCGKYTPPGYDHFERHNGSWRIKCVKCTSGRTVKDTDKEVVRVKRLRDKEVLTMKHEIYEDCLKVLDWLRQLNADIKWESNVKAMIETSLLLYCKEDR